MHETGDAAPSLYDQAYAAFDEGRLRDAAILFTQLIEEEPGQSHLHYMQGLVHKYRRDWATSLAQNLQAQALEAEIEQSTCWNAGIAASALGNWPEARRQWSRAGIRLTEGEGPPDESGFGRCCLRLNPWGAAETLWARRLCPCRARIENVPYPESGYRYGDLVLTDGAATGERQSNGRTYPVLNVMQRLERSEFQTFVVFVRCDSAQDRDALLDATLPGIGLAEDWTQSKRALCRRCSYGLTHAHIELPHGVWKTDRELGIAAQSRVAVEKLVGEWCNAGAGRHVDGIETRNVSPGSPEDGSVWWHGSGTD